jgi:hypothetical protein
MSRLDQHRRPQAGTARARRAGRLKAEQENGYVSARVITAQVALADSAPVGPLGFYHCPVCFPAGKPPPIEYQRYHPADCGQH